MITSYYALNFPRQDVKDIRCVRLDNQKFFRASGLKIKHFKRFYFTLNN